MPNVWDAMKKHEAEKAAAPQAAGAPPGQESPPAQGEAPAAKAPPAGPVAAAADGPGNGQVRLGEMVIAHCERGGAITEEYRSLRTNLLAQSPDERFCYLVTSAEAGEGKTVTCLNLAVVMAERVDRRTIMVDCDLRKGKMAKTLGDPGRPGVADLLRGTATIKEVVRKTPYPNLFFMPAGQVPQEKVGELLGRPEMEEVIESLRRDYDYVILDTPPINAISDAGALGRAAGEAILVVRMNKTNRESADKAVRLLHAANVKLSGIVLTHRKYYIPGYLYRYS